VVRPEQPQHHGSGWSGEEMIRSLPPIARARRQTAFVVRRLQELNS